MKATCRRQREASPSTGASRGWRAGSQAVSFKRVEIDRLESRRRESLAADRRIDLDESEASGARMALPSWRVRATAPGCGSTFTGSQASIRRHGRIRENRDCAVSIRKM